MPWAVARSRRRAVSQVRGAAEPRPTETPSRHPRLSKSAVGETPSCLARRLQRLLLTHSEVLQSCLCACRQARKVLISRFDDASHLHGLSFQLLPRKEDLGVKRSLEPCSGTPPRFFISGSGGKPCTVRISSPERKAICSTRSCSRAPEAA